MTDPDSSPNAFERGMPGTAGRSRTEAIIEEVRRRGGMFVDAVRATRMAMALSDPTLPGNPIVFANQSFLDLSGYSMDEVLGQQPHFMNGPDTDPQDATDFREALAQDRDVVIETVQYRKDGSRFVSSVLLTAFKDEAGETLYQFLSWADVTRRVDAERDVDELRRTQAALARSEERLAGELAAARRLQKISTELIPEHRPEALYEQLLDAAMGLMRSDAASMQMLERDGSRLRLLASRNFHPESAAHWQWVEVGGSSACGRALKGGARSLIADVEDGSAGMDDGDLAAFRRSGLRSAQSTPLVARDGTPLGMLSTHWREPHRPEPRDFDLFDVLARQAADLIERTAAEAASRESQERQAFLLELSDVLRPISDAKEARRRGMELLLDFLNLDQTFYFRSEHGPEGWAHVVDYDDVHRPGIPVRKGRRLHSEFGAAIFAGLAKGQAVTVSDVDRLGELTPEQRANYAAAKLRAFLVVPILKKGRFVAGVSAQSASPRVWTESDVAVVQEVAERTWAAAERATAETALAASEEKYRTLFDTMGQGYCELELLRDADGRAVDQLYLDLNPTFERLFGVPAAKAKGRRASEIFPDLDACWTESFDRVARTGMQARMEQPVGERWFEVFAYPHGGDRLVVLYEEVTDRKRAEKALRRSEQRLRQFGEASQDVLWIRDAKTLQWVYLTPAFEAIYGVRREDALEGDNYRSWLDLILPEDREEAERTIARVRAGDQVAFDYRIRRRSDGAIRWLHNTDFPIRDERGEVALIGGIGHDFTDLRESEQRARLLLSELQHRVRNTLAVVRSIVRRTAETSDDVEQMSGHLQGRLDAFARVQAAVTRTASGGVELMAIVEDELLAHATAEGPHLALDGPDVTLHGKAAEAMSLAVHELASNAVQHGALANGGRVEVRWRTAGRDGAKRLDLAWTESGLSEPLGEPRRRGFGMTMLEQSLPYELGAETGIEFRPEGLRFTLSMPLPGSAEANGAAAPSS